MNNEDVVTQGRIGKQPMASAEIVKDVSEFAVQILKKCNGDTAMLILASRVFNNLTEASVAFEMARRDCGRPKRDAVEEFIKELKNLGADVHVVKIDK